MKYLFIFLINFIFQLSKFSLFIFCMDNNALNKNLPSIISLFTKETLLSKKTFILNKGTDDTYLFDSIIEENKLKLIEQNLIKKKILEVLLDNSTCNINKLELIEKYSFLFNEDKGLKKDFDEFLTS